MCGWVCLTGCETQYNYKRKEGQSVWSQVSRSASLASSIYLCLLSAPVLALLTHPQ